MTTKRRKKPLKQRVKRAAKVPQTPAVLMATIPAAFPQIADLKRRAFLLAFCGCGNVSEAAAAVGITDRTHRNWLTDPEYAEAFADAKEHAADELEREAWRRAIHGVRRYKFSPGGKPYLNPVTGEPYYELDYSDTLLIFLLKGLRPGKFRDRVEHTGAGGGPIRVQPVRLDTLTDEQLAQLEAADAIVRAPRS